MPKLDALLDRHGSQEILYSTCDLLMPAGQLDEKQDTNPAWDVKPHWTSCSGRITGGRNKNL